MVQLLRPASTISYTSGLKKDWYSDTYHDAVNEESYDTSTYIEAGDNGSSSKTYYAEFGLGTFNLPTVGDGKLRAYLYMENKTYAKSPATVRLYRNTTEIAYVTTGWVSTGWYFLETTVPSADLQSLTDPSELKVEAEVRYAYYYNENQGDQRYTQSRCSWIEVEIPDGGSLFLPAPLWHPF